jgi:aminopeptidase N
LGSAGDLPLYLKNSEPDFETSDNTYKVIELTQSEQTFVFERVQEKPVPSLLRGFSAPVKLHYDYSREDLTLLMSSDSDGFNRWDASQQLALQVINEVIAAYQRGEDINNLRIDSRVIDAFKSVLEDKSLDQAMVAYMLSLPSEAYISELADVVDVEAIHYSRAHVRKTIARELRSNFESIYSDYDHEQTYSATAEAIASRSLKNVALAYLMLLNDDKIIRACEQQYVNANNMTDVMAALTQLVNTEAPLAQSLSGNALADFYERWQHESLVVNQWLTVQATCSLPDTLSRVEALEVHNAYDSKNPNKIRALVSSFCNNNAINFHDKAGEGYKYLADKIIVLNKQNPQIASRLLTPLTKWKKYNPERQALMKSQLERIMAEPDLSKDVFEVVSKSLV